jgi:hypothetical protein
MAFNPLGEFPPAAQPPESIVAKAKAFLKSLPRAPVGSLSRIYLHWTGLPFGQTPIAYNGVADFLGGEWSLVLTHDPRDNAGITGQGMAAHTWHRNAAAIGVAIAGMSSATENDFGSDALTPTGLDHVCAAAAAFAACYGIDPLGTVERGTTHLDYSGAPIDTTGEHSILTHAECARIDGYLRGFTSDSDCRWDLGTLVALPPGITLSKEMVSQCGDALRRRVHAYTTALMSC